MLLGCGETKMALYRNQLLRYFGIVKFLMSLFLIFHRVPVFAQTVEIKLVDGRNGHPLVGTSSYVNVWVGKERKGAIATPTDARGVARIQLTTNTDAVNIPNSESIGSTTVDHPIVKYGDSFQIRVPYVLCVSDGSNYSWLRLVDFSTKEILQHGYVSPNTCGKVENSPQPGQVILFVRPLTLWEKLKQ